MRLLTFLAILLLLITTSVAQTEATIKFEVIMTADDPEMKAELTKFQNSRMNMYMKDKKLRQDLFMGGMENTIMISNFESKEELLLMKDSMGKFALKQEIVDESEEEDNRIELIDETKKIAGFECKKAIIYNNEVIESVIWYTDEIDAPRYFRKYLKEGVPGMPLEFSVIKPTLSMTFTATAFSDEVKNPQALFSMEIPEGYEEIKTDELENMNGGAQ